MTRRQRTTRQGTLTDDQRVDSGGIEVTLHLHHLTGCSPAPLASYLKALGILRLVAEQADPDARGWWQDEHFCLLTKLSKLELESFFLDKYEPTAIFNPWGGRSGYYGGSNEKTARVALVEIERSSTDRLSEFREAISAIRSVVERQGGEKPEAEETKTKMIDDIRKRIRGTGADWLGTVMADLGDSFRGPPIMGTGGNEGSGSYTDLIFRGCRRVHYPGIMEHRIANKSLG